MKYFINYYYENNYLIIKVELIKEGQLQLWWNELNLDKMDFRNILFKELYKKYGAYLYNIILQKFIVKFKIYFKLDIISNNNEEEIIKEIKNILINIVS